MGRPPRADEANGIYHMLNRGNRREPVFHKTEDFEAFERMMVEAMEHLQIKLFAYCLLPNHWHMVVSPGQEYRGKNTDTYLFSCGSIGFW
jgi:putative transposase